MRRVRISELLASGEPGTKQTVHGWVRSVRRSRNCGFIALSDGSGQQTIQLVVANQGAAWDLIQDLHTGGAIRAEGLLVESPGKGQRVEMHVNVDGLHVYGDADTTYPLQKKGHTLEFLRTIPHLRTRTNTFGAVFRVRNVLANAVHKYFQNQGFIWAHTPLLTATDGEGAGEMFQVTSLDPKDHQGREQDYEKDFFGRKTWLTVTGQLEAEFVALGLGDVYTFGPTFRAENSNTARHLAEFWMIEPEMSFCDLSGNIDMAEGFIQYLIREALEHCQDDLAFFEKMYKTQSVAELEKVSQQSVERMTYHEAVKILMQSGEKFEFPVFDGCSLSSEHETWLAKSHVGGPVAVTDYPIEQKAFYMRRNDDGKTVAAVDILVPGVGELVGGSQREERLDVLEERLRETGLDAHDLQWYVDLRKYGSVPHAGFGMGFERMVMYVTGMQNIRDVILCPRTPGCLVNRR
ncbi:MAG: asparagine--tRNA ligase [Oligoflexales bacterium]